MREKIYNVFVKIYGAVLMVSFFAGILPLIPFIVAIIIGGPAAEDICIFLYKTYYPYVIAGASLAVFIGWIAMYIGKKQGLTVKNEKSEENK